MDTEIGMETETPYTSNWRKVVDLIQTDFQVIQLLAESTCQVVVRIPKVGGDFCGIGLVEVVCKMV